MSTAISLEDFLRETASSCEEFAETRAHARTLEQLADSLLQPFSVAIVGRMKSGKSTLINSLIGYPLAISDVEEATATINWIGYGRGSQTEQAIVHWRDGRNEVIDRQRMSEWSGKTPEVVDRCRKTAWIELFADLPELKKFHIIDTPGTGSAVAGHEEVAREFLDARSIDESHEQARKADAIIYVITPAVKQDAVETLEEFEKSRLPGTGPYNSVCVLHKWDGLEEADPIADAARKAGAWKEKLGAFVADVLPVSGPLGLAARHAPDAFFRALIDVAAHVPEADRKFACGSSERWDRDAARCQCRAVYRLHWLSFRLLVRLLWAQRISDAAAARALCKKASQVEALEAFLRDRFFARAGIIKQSHTLHKAEQEMQRIILKLRDHVTRLEASDQLAAEVSDAAGSLAPRHQDWIAETRREQTKELRRVRETLANISNRWNQQELRLRRLHNDLRVCDMIAARPEHFPEAEREGILDLCNALATRGRTGASPLRWTVPELMGFIDKYRVFANSAARSEEPLFQHIVDRLTQAANLCQPDAST